MCIFDTVKRTKGWKEDPNLSFNDNLFFGAVHFTQVFFGKYRVVRHNNDDFDDMAADCAIAVYEAAKRNMDKWDRTYRLDQYLYGRAWSVVGNWLKNYFIRKQRTPIDAKMDDGKSLTPRDYDVGLDEIGSNNYAQGTRYVVFKETPRSYYEKKLSDAAGQFLDYYEECIDLGIVPVQPEDFLTNKNSKESDLRYLDKILTEKVRQRRPIKKCRKPSLDRL